MEADGAPRLLKPRRMPPKYVMDQAPLLAWLEHNTIYHIMSCRRPRIGYSIRQVSAWGYNLVYLNYVIGGLAIRSSGSIIVPFFFLGSILSLHFYTWVIIRRRKREVSFREFFGIDDVRLLDLQLIPVSSEEIALGVWGYRCQINIRRFILPAFAPAIIVWSVDPTFQYFANAIILGVTASLPAWIWFLSRQQAALGVYLAMVETGEFLNLSKMSGAIESGAGMQPKHGWIGLVMLLQIFVFVLLAVYDMTMMFPNPVFAISACLSASVLGGMLADHMHFAREACWSRLMFNCEAIQRMLNQEEGE